jgi:hypothetical protein
VLSAARRVLVALLVFAAAGALASVTLGGPSGKSAVAAYTYYCPDGSSASNYTYCPPPNRPPDCSTVRVDPTSLWPPNHKFRLVTLGGGSDPDGDTLTLAITGVTQDEPVNGVADGNTAPDALAGPTPGSVHLRRERAGNGNGRVYRIAFTLSDGKGGTCSGVVKVEVPHNKKKAAIDSAPPSYNSFSTS